jgi:hypothetical protein
MDADLARDILSTMAVNNDCNRILKGMRLLATHGEDTNVSFAAAHDRIYFGAFEVTVEKMTEEEVRQMAAWGWFESEDSWSHHT